MQATLTDSARRWAMRVLFCGVALGATSFVMSITAGPLAAEDITSTTSLTGLPWTAGVLGTGLSSVVLSRLMSRRGRRYGLIAGYIAGAAGAAMAVWGIGIGSLAVLVAGMLVFGAGNAANHLSRYAASDLYTPDKRATALGTIAWGSTIGGVVGPTLLAPAAAIGVSAGLPSLAGPFALTMIGLVLAAVLYSVLLRPIAVVEEDPGIIAPVGGHFRIPRVQVALVALASAQTVMIMVMTMTPVHIRSHGHGLQTVGFVLSAHVFGMYGLSPICGKLTDRFGSPAMITAGFATLVGSSVAAALTPVHGGAVLALPLFGLGLGWSMCFVAGSALLTHGLSYSERTKLQGTTDGVVWTSAAAASLASGPILSSIGYAGVCVVAAALVAVPTAMALSRRFSRNPAPVS